MSFFDEVETTVANTRFLQAVEDTGPVSLPLHSDPQKDAACRAAEARYLGKGVVNIDFLLAPQTTAQYLFKQFLVTRGEEDAVCLLRAVEQYRKAGSARHRMQIATQLLKEHPALGAPLPPPAEAATASVSPPTASPKGNPIAVAAARSSAAAAYAVADSDSAPISVAEDSIAPALNRADSNGGGGGASTGVVGAAARVKLASHPSAEASAVFAESSVMHDGGTPRTQARVQLARIHSTGNGAAASRNGAAAAGGAESAAASGNAAAASSSGCEAAAAPAHGLPESVPCLDTVLSTPLSAHPCCALLVSTAGQKVAELQQLLLHSSAGAKLPPTLLDGLYARLRTRLSEFVGTFLSSAYYNKLIALSEYASRPITLDMFRIFRVLGRGAFGAVSAVQKLDTHAIFAMKEMSKKQIKADGSEWMVLNEMYVLSKMNSPFVLGLNYAFHEKETLHLVFAMCTGGDLKFHLRNAEHNRFDERRTKFYTSEIILGLEHLHSQDIVYRDLKPNNILLHQSGHLVISDLGLTIKLRKNKVLKHLAGTAGYWSPEIVAKKGTFKASDLWSLGVLIYEMLTGNRPECKCSKEKKGNNKEWCPFGQRRSMEENALDPEGCLTLSIDYPANLISPLARDLLEKLFEPDPTLRLGAHGVALVKAHPWFEDVDWEALARLEVTPPYVPDARTVHAGSVGEVGDFSTENEKLKHVVLTPEDDKTYEPFNYTSVAGVQQELLDALAKIDNPNANKNKQENASTAGNEGCCCTVM